MVKDIDTKPTMATGMTVTVQKMEIEIETEVVLEEVLLVPVVPLMIVY